MREIFKAFCMMLFIITNTFAMDLQNVSETGQSNTTYSEYKLRVNELTKRIANVVDALIKEANDPNEKSELFREFAQTITYIVTIQNGIILLKRRYNRNLRDDYS